MARRSYGAFLLATVILLSFTALLGADQAAHAGLPPPAYCSTLIADGGGSWDGLSTCTYTATLYSVYGHYTITSGTFEVTSGTTLVINAYADINVNSGTTFLVDSGATVLLDENQGNPFSAIYDSGTLNNYGTMTNENGLGTGGLQVEFGASVNNYGTMNSQNTDYSGGFGNSGTFNNYGTMNLQNTGPSSTGVANQGSFTNNAGAYIYITNSGTSTGLYNGFSGSFTNSGTIVIENSGASNGIVNEETFDNYGSILIENTGPGGYGFYNSGGLTCSPNPCVAALTNYPSGTIRVQNHGTYYGIYNKDGTIANAGTMTAIHNVDSLGNVFNTCGGIITGFADYIQQSPCTVSSVPEFPFAFVGVVAVAFVGLVVIRRIQLSGPRTTAPRRAL